MRQQEISQRIIVDHIRTICVCISDGVQPGNAGRGYCLRRLIRRCLVHGRLHLGIGSWGSTPFLHRLVPLVITTLGEHYQTLSQGSELVVKILTEEETKFDWSLSKGMKQFEKLTHGIPRGGLVTGHILFKLHDTYGMTWDVLEIVCKERKFQMDRQGFLREMQEHQHRTKPSNSNL
jgi:alanyl-tRNA synthetase